MQDGKRSTGWLRFWAAGALVLVAAGCNDSAELTSPTAKRLRMLMNAYLDYAVAKGAGPANQSQLQAHLANVPGFLLAAGGISPETKDEAFRSPRDGEPFIIQYGLGVTCAGDAPPIACERTGRDGTRWAAFANGKIARIDEVAAKELMQGKP
jgi:hypothetical protein